MRTARRWLRLRLKDRPLLWREMFAARSHSRLARVCRGLLLTAIVLAMLGTLWQFADCAGTSRWNDFLALAMWLGTILESLGLLLAAAWASNTIASERENETWTTLISTPLEASEVLIGKLAGSLYAARLVVPPLALVWLLAAIAEPRFMPAIAGTLLGLAAAAVAVGMVGIAFSFWCDNATRALGATLASLFAAVTLGTCCIFPFGFINPLYLLVLPGFMNLFALHAPAEATWPLAVASLFYGGLWLLGIVVHLIGAWLLWFYCVQRFDRLAGRIDARVPPFAAGR
jgi:ABC-type transport system involved in multi-copper enzyme maturation permease subunit